MLINPAVDQWEHNIHLGILLCITRMLVQGAKVASIFNLIYTLEVPTPKYVTLSLVSRYLYQPRNITK